jgi:hypothetical protein
MIQNSKLDSKHWRHTSGFDIVNHQDSKHNLVKSKINNASNTRSDSNLLLQNNQINNNSNEKMSIMSINNSQNTTNYVTKPYNTPVD